MNSGRHVSFYIYLNEGEQFDWTTPTGDIKVRQVRCGEGFATGQITVRGFAYKKDRTMALIQREGRIKFDELPEEVKKELLDLASKKIQIAGKVSI